MNEHQPPDSPQAQDSPQAIGDDERCWRYLLGELDVSESAELERQLSSSPQLADALLRQADLINGLSALEPQSPVVAATTRILPWAFAASVLAIAACLAIAILGVQSRSIDDDAQASRRLSPRGVGPDAITVAEDLLIARAWADSRGGEESDEFAFVDFDGDDSFPADEAVPADESGDVDSTLSWMFIAVAANPDLGEAVDEGAANDG